jgi:hypothetical protein
LLTGAVYAASSIALAKMSATAAIWYVITCAYTWRVLA